MAATDDPGARSAPSGAQGAAAFQRGRRRSPHEPPTLESDARLGLEQGEFHLLYQVRVDPRTEEVGGVEALLRWRDTYRGVMSPNLFLPPLAGTAVMGQLGRWVLAQACLQATRWEARRPPSHPTVIVAVNATGAQALHDGFVEFVAGALEVSGIDPQLLQLEVGLRGEEARDPVLVKRLTDLAGLGLHVALDGVDPTCGNDGFLPSQSVNLARRWIRTVATDRRAAESAGALIERAHAAGRAVCAVGVEQRDQVEALATLGCDLVQGFLYGEPAPAAELGWQAPKEPPPAPAAADPTAPSSSRSSMTGSGPLPKRKRKAG